MDESTHDVVFTANTTAAIKLVAEGYPFGPDRPLVVSADNHNSVLGIREYARRVVARVQVLPLDDELRLECGGNACLPIGPPASRRLTRGRLARVFSCW